MLLFDPQQIVNGVQNGVLPLDVILQPKDCLGLARIKCGERRERGLLARDDG